MKSKSLFLFLPLAVGHWSALAHEGHGMASSVHWHATDTLGFLGLAVVAAVVWFIGRGK